MTRLVFAGIAALSVAAGCRQAEAPPPAPASAPAVSTTSDDVQTRIGVMNFERGYPTAETARKLFDELDYQRAVQAYLWGYPAVSFESIRIATKRDLNGELNDMFIADKFADAQSVFLTANDTTIYAYTNVDLGKAGPVVIDVPPGRIVGLIDDFWQRAIADVGLPGPYGDKGGKFLLLPPGYKGDVPKDGYQVLRGTMNNYNIMVRGIVTSMEDTAEAVQTVKKLQVYPWSERSNPKATTFCVVLRPRRSTRSRPPASNTGRACPPSSTTTRSKSATASSWRCSSPWASRRASRSSPTRGNAPSSRMRPASATRWGARCCSKAISASAGATAFGGTHWNWVVLNRFDQETEHYSQLDERLHYTYGAIYTSPNIGSKKPGPGSEYVQTFKDKDGNHLDGAKSYRLHVPPDVPAASFWSLTLYDTATRSMVVNASRDAARSSYDKLKANADGSVDLYFGPKAPAGFEGNWIETVPGKGFYPMFRFYAPKPGVFDGSWKLPDVELMK